MSIQAVLTDDGLSQTASVTGDAAQSLGQLNIAIIGAGLVGLATAAMMRKEGHRITIFESSSFHAEIGAGIVLTPNGVGILKKLLPELTWENMQTVDLRSVEMFNSDGTHTNSVDLSEAWNSYPQGWFMIHRVDLHKELMRLALDLDANDFPPAAIRLGTPIRGVDFDSKHPSVTTLSGEEFKYDLILGTDGIKSTVRKCMIGAEHDAPPGPMAFYRWMIDLKKNPELSWICEDRNTTGPTNVSGKDIWLFMYPLRKGNLINISAAHLDKRDQDAVDWNAEAPMDTFQAAFEDFSDKFMPLVSAAEKPRVVQLRRMPTIPTWIKGSVALLGDAAHAMNPTYGQGFAMGLEDAATIATLVPSGTKLSEISSRVKIYEQLRKPRAERVSQMSTDGLKIDIATLFGSSWIVPELLGYEPVEIAKAALSKI
ncbi:FAD/NAD(P)-binding domain-containing protein [Mycena floridula]|nr:FAD/NAD(P)-binding domain-containing protein [Mycena floridula]